ncbi:carbohydrate kinase family protein [Deinococcus roseus]|uniref:Fructokinase n=1 Tax=Deinococcus roseus TaxID=392414 RepID=A0ABQ2D6K3_9DEIO|nr:carbohydrate kinase [Deinococcus roseus]GGJ45593.1 fructokinase [Deinococcus roseus]
MNLAQFVSAGEALTDLIQVEPGVWHSKAGGAGWNVARVVARLGLPSAFAGGISQDDFGEDLHQKSVAGDLDLRYLQRHAAAPLLAMVPETNPPRYFFVGNDSADLHFDPHLLPEGWWDEVKTLHFGGISLTRDPLKTTLVNLAEQARSLGKFISFDPNYRITMTAAYRPTFQRMVELSDLIKVSDEDLQGLLPELTAEEALAQIRAWNATAWIMLTEGAKGAVLMTPDGEIFEPAFKITVADTVGAGDASIGALNYSLMTHKDWGIEGHLRYALAAAAVNCTRAGAYAPTREEVQALLEK